MGMSIMGNPLNKKEKFPSSPIPVQIISLVVYRENIDSPQTVARKAIHRRYRVYPDGDLVYANTGHATGLLYGEGPVALISRRPEEGYLPYSPPLRRRRRHPAGRQQPQEERSNFNFPIINLRADFVDYGFPKEKQVVGKDQSQVIKTEEQVSKSEEKDQSQDENVLPPEEENAQSQVENSRVFRMVNKIKKCRCESICRKIRNVTKKLNKCCIM